MFNSLSTSLGEYKPMIYLQTKNHSQIGRHKVLIESALEKQIITHHGFCLSLGEMIYSITMRTEEVILFNNLQDIIDFLESCLELNKNTNSFCLVMPVPIHFNGEIVNQHSV
jgi:hypothetical protein